MKESTQGHILTDLPKCSVLKRFLLFQALIAMSSTEYLYSDPDKTSVGIHTLCTCYSLGEKVPCLWSLYHMPWLAMQIWSIWEVTKCWAHWRWAGAAGESMLKKVMLLIAILMPCRHLKGDSHIRLKDARRAATQWKRLKISTRSRGKGEEHDQNISESFGSQFL